MTNMHLVEYDYDEPKPAKKILAKALYDNMAESTDELAFRKGDILTVIETDLTDSPGWWLCQLRGLQGICPGNRLKIIQNHDSGIFSPSSSPSPCPSITSSAYISSPTSPTDYDNTQNGKRRSWHISPHKVLTPHKYGDVYLYDQLPNQRISSTPSENTYDVPKPAVPVTYDTPNKLKSRIVNDSTYDVPRPSQNFFSPKMSPCSSRSSLLTIDNTSISSSNRSSLANIPDYDIPRRIPRNMRHSQMSSMSISSFGSSSRSSTYDYLHSSMSSPLSESVIKDLPLELTSALETLDKLQNEASTAVAKLLGFVHPGWRTKEKLDPVLMDLRLAVVRLRTALHDLSEFGEGALGNVVKSNDKMLVIKLQPLVKALKLADKLIHEASQNLDSQGWTVVMLQRPEATQKLQQQLPPDSLDQLIACSQNLTEDVRQIASFVNGNATLLFKRTKIISNVPNNNNTIGEIPEDYDYVSFETKEASVKANTDICEALPNELKKNFENLMRNADDELNDNKQESLDQNDKSVLIYYATQAITHMAYLTEAIDAFLKVVEQNQPPKFFLAHGKFVILSAHNLVSIGDIVHRNISSESVKHKVLSCADSLSEALKTCVAKTKGAAQNFPNVVAVQEMVDAVVDISHLASDLKKTVLANICWYPEFGAAMTTEVVPEDEVFCSTKRRDRKFLAREFGQDFGQVTVDSKKENRMCQEKTARQSHDNSG